MCTKLEPRQDESTSGNQVLSNYWGKKLKNSMNFFRRIAHDDLSKEDINSYAQALTRLNEQGYSS